MPKYSHVPDEGHGRWLDGSDASRLVRLSKKDEMLGGDGVPRFAQAMLDELTRGHYARAGKFLGIEGSRIIVPAGALKEVYSDASFEIRPRLLLDVDDYGEVFESMIMFAFAIPNGLSLPSMLGACNAPFPVRVDMLEEVCSVFAANMAIDGTHPASAASDAVNACLALDQIVVRAMVDEAVADPNAVIPPLDISEMLNDCGFSDKQASAQAEGFRERYANPEWQLLAPFTLPYNLDVAADAGILDAVVAEAATMPFGLGGFVEGRWFFGREIVQALRRRGFSESQIGYIACSDHALFGFPTDRVEAARLCADIEGSAFDPESADDWGAYTASEGTMLVDFLGATAPGTPCRSGR